MTLRNDRLVIPQGTSWEVRWPVQDEQGNPADLTGWSPRAQARERITSSEVLHEWTDAKGTISVVDGGSTISMRVAPAISSAWPWRTAYFDVELVHTDGRVARISQGELRVDPEVTR